MEGKTKYKRAESDDCGLLREQSRWLQQYQAANRISLRSPSPTLITIILQSSRAIGHPMVDSVFDGFTGKRLLERKADRRQARYYWKSIPIQSRDV